MHSNEMNKIFCAVLAALTFTLGLSIFAEELFRPERPAQPAFRVATAEAAAPAPQAAATEPVDMIKIMAEADVARGQQAFRVCTQCHTAEKGGPNRVGPNLWNTVGGKMGHIDGFNYSQAIRRAQGEGRQWTFEELYRFLENPRGHLPGTTMSFAGIRRSSERADLIAYLRSLSDSPVPLPQ